MLVVALGPALSVLWAQSWLAGKMDSSMMSLAIVAIIIFWSPLFFSIPAFLMQDARDATLTGLRGIRRLERAFRLTPELLSRRSSVRLEMWLSILGLGFALFLAGPQLGDAFNLLGF